MPWAWRSILPTSVSRSAASARSQRPHHHPETSPTGEWNPPPAGASVSATGKLTNDLTLGATWASKTKSGKLEKYKGLFAEEGGFDIPANYGVGLAWAPTPALILAADIKRIEYSDVKAVANPIGNLFTGNAFGTANGPGMG